MYTRPVPKPAPREKKPPKRLRRRGNTAHARRPRDFDYLGKVARLPCIVSEMSYLEAANCSGRTEVDHAFGRYVKNADRLTIPLCTKHHRDKTGPIGGGGFFGRMSRALRRGWLEIAVLATQTAIQGEPHGG